MTPSKDRLVAETAAAAGRSDAAFSAAERAMTIRDSAMVRAKAGGASYKELQSATGLTRTGVYKALSSSVGGSLKIEATPTRQVS